MDIRLRDVSNFVTASSSSKLTEAANLLRISQPALSESIKRLENDLGFKVFYRSKAGIHLTPSGRDFLIKAKSAIKAFDDLTFKDHSYEHVFGKKVISLGCHPTVGQYTLPKAFKMLQQKAPDYKFSLHHGLSREIQQKIQAGLIDLGIVVNPQPAPDLIIKELENDRVRVWKSPNGCNENILFCDPSLIQTQAILKRLKIKNIQIIETQSLELISEFAFQGLGLGLIPERVVNMHHPQLKLIEKSPIFYDVIALVYRPEFGKNIPEKLTIESIKSVFKS